MPTITATQGEEKVRERVTEWSHEVMLLRVIDLGTQLPHPNSPFQDPQRQIEFIFEVLDQTIKVDWKDKPMRLFDKVSPYISYKEDKVTNYHKKVNSLVGKALPHKEAKVVDYETLLGSVYTVQVTYNKWWYETITSITKVSKKVAELYANYVTENESFVFSLEDFDEILFTKLSEKKKEQIKKSPEYQNIWKEPINDPEFSEEPIKEFGWPHPADDLPF